MPLYFGRKRGFTVHFCLGWAFNGAKLRTVCDCILNPFDGCHHKFRNHRQTNSSLRPLEAPITITLSGLGTRNWLNLFIHFLLWLATRRFIFEQKGAHQLQPRRSETPMSHVTAVTQLSVKTTMFYCPKVSVVAALVFLPYSSFSCVKFPEIIVSGVGCFSADIIRGIMKILA